MVTYENLFQYTIMLITLVGIYYQIFTRKKINRQLSTLGGLLIKHIEGRLFQLPFFYEKDFLLKPPTWTINGKQKKQNKDDRKISSSFPFLGYHTDSQKSVISCQAFHYGATNL